MNLRFSTVRLAPVFTVLVATCLAVAAIGLYSPAAAQAQSSASSDWVMPRTPDGRPDLQGNWSNATITPFERPEDVESPFLTWEELERREGRAAQFVERVSRPSDPNRAAPEAGGNVGGYNGIYIDRGDKVAVVDGMPLSSLVTFPDNGRVPDRTPEGARLAAEYREFRSQFGSYDHPELRPLGERCIVSFGRNIGPPMLPNGFYNNNYQIVQTADHILIMAEMVHDARIIRIGDGPRLPDHVRPWMGDSWGHWEGDVLVVETTNINALHRWRGNPTDNLKVIERFSRVDEETILYEFTIDDPTIYTSQWGGKVPMRALHDNIYEYACHEGNYALSNILSGERYQERMKEEAIGARD
jgi:hypothetical protein